MIIRSRFRCAVMTLMIVVLLGGCTSGRSSTRFYTLSPMDDLKTLQPGTSVHRDLSLAVGPVEVPDYLDRFQIVTRTTRNELKRADFDRWAGSLKADIARVISENLAILTSSEQIYPYPWDPSLVPGYQVKINITRFDGSLGGKVYLNAHWSVLEKKKVTFMKSSSFNVETTGSGYRELVAAKSYAIEKLSRLIADAILSGSE